MGTNGAAIASSAGMSIKRTAFAMVLALAAIPSLATGCWHERVHDRAVYVEPRHEVRHDVIVEHHDDHHDDHYH